MRILLSAGLSARDAARAAYHCNNFVTEFVADEERLTALVAAARGSRKTVFTEVRKHFKSLPAAEYPTIVQLADALCEDDPDGLFEFGLEIWIAGLQRLARSRRSPATGSHT